MKLTVPAVVAGLLLGLSSCSAPTPTPTPTTPPGAEVVIEGRRITGNWSLGCVTQRDSRRIVLAAKDAKGTYQNATVKVNLTPDGQAVESFIAAFNYANGVTRTLSHSARGAAAAGTSATLVVTGLTYDISGTGRLVASATAEGRLVPYRFTITCPEWQDFG